MIYEISRELRDELEARKVPLPVSYGPERHETTRMLQSRIVLERDRSSGDSIGARRSDHKSPKLHWVRGLGCVLRVYAKSSVDGANVYDHERIADQAIDKVLVALRKVLAVRKTLWRPTSARFLSAAELDALGLEQWASVVYELRFTVDRGVFDTDWEDAAAETYALTGINSRTQVGEEIACGEEP